jgi:hypothetical protein
MDIFGEFPYSGITIGNGDSIANFALILLFYLGETYSPQVATISRYATVIWKGKL